MEQQPRARLHLLLSEAKTRIKGLCTYVSQALFIIAFGLSASFCLSIYYGIKNQKITQLKEEGIFLTKRLEQIKKKEAKEKELASRLSLASYDYVEREIESLCLLAEESQTTKILTSDTKNMLRFREENFQRKGNLQEVELIQDYPVQMNRQDLLKFFSRIDQVDLGITPPRRFCPILEVEKLTLQRLSTFGKETYLVSCKLIKKETIHE